MIPKIRIKAAAEILSVPDSFAFANQESTEVSERPDDVRLDKRTKS